jgi:hypothetical protein
LPFTFTAAKVARLVAPCSIEGIVLVPPNPSINRTAFGSRLSQTLDVTQYLSSFTYALAFSSFCSLHVAGDHICGVT